MLFVPIAGDFNSIYKEKRLQDIATIIEQDKVTNRISLLQNIILSTESVSKTLVNTEDNLFDFMKRSSSLSLSIYEISKKHPDAAIQLLRSLFETGVLFRNWIQTITIKNDIPLFKEVGERFKDAAIMEEYDLYHYNKSKELFDIKSKYPIRNKVKSLQSSYDWLKPTFSNSELKHLSRQYTPSFRDLIYKSSLTDYSYRDTIELYEDSSSIIHYSGLTKVVLNSIKESDVINYLSIFIKAIVIDYLSLIDKMYSGNSKELEFFNLYLTQMKKDIIRYWK